MMEKIKKIPLVLIILDGWGIAPPSLGNAITQAKTPMMDYLYENYPHTKLAAHGLRVGLPHGQCGNSEAGHMNLGAGRIVDQDAIIISNSIKDGSFFQNSAFIEAIRYAQKNKSNIHLMGLFTGTQSAHSLPDHLDALLKLTREKFKGKVFLHLFTDGRDAPPYESLNLITKFIPTLKRNERIVTISGRYYAMDRKKNWKVTAQSYHALTLCQGRYADDPVSAITQAYNRGESDEYIQPTVILPPGSSRRYEDLGGIGDNDAVIFFNLRSDRARQLTKPFVQANFTKLNKGAFKRRKILKKIRFVAMTDFGPDLENVLTAYPTKDIVNTLPIVLKNLRQLYIAEAEKYAHITYFFNGGYANPVGNEERIMVPSPNVKSYAQTPEMSLKKIIQIVKPAITSRKYDFIAVNFANPDMIGHTGDLQAGIKAVEIVDKGIEELLKTILKIRGRVIITADHGNIEQMVDLKTGEKDTEHSKNLVPFILVDKKYKNKHLREGILGDVAPTILDLLGFQKPEEMRGRSLI